MRPHQRTRTGCSPAARCWCSKCAALKMGPDETQRNPARPLIFGNFLPGQRRTPNAKAQPPTSNFQRTHRHTHTHSPFSTRSRPLWFRARRPALSRGPAPRDWLPAGRPLARWLHKRAAYGITARGCNRAQRSQPSASGLRAAEGAAVVAVVGVVVVVAAVVVVVVVVVKVFCV